MTGLDQVKMDFGKHGVNEIQIKNWFREAFWNWYEANKHEAVFTIKVWILKRTITIEDCKPVFERFFGQAPLTTGMIQGVV